MGQERVDLLQELLARERPVAVSIRALEIVRGPRQASEAKRGARRLASVARGGRVYEHAQQQHIGAEQAEHDEPNRGLAPHPLV